MREVAGDCVNLGNIHKLNKEKNEIRSNQTVLVSLPK